MRGRPRQIESTSKALSEIPKAPSWLAAAAKSEWRKIVPILVERQTLTVADLSLVESYCTAVARIRDAEKIIGKEGATYSIGDVPKRHPAVTLQDAAIKTARLCAGELGLTPLSRQKLPGSEGQDDEPSPLDL